MTKLIKTGEVAELNAEIFCKQFFLPYSKATPYMQKQGFDFTYFDGKKNVTVDVKNTFDIYLFNIKKDNKTLYIRQPFKYKNKTDELWVQDKFTQQFVYQGPVEGYMQKFFTTKNYARFLTYLHSLEKKKIEIPAVELKLIKDKLISLTKQNCYVNYKETDGQYSMRIVTYADKNYMMKNQGWY